MYDFSNKKILIIGASSGIGEETSKLLAKQGAEVILVARREEQLKEICNEIGYEKAKYYTADMSDIDTIENLFDNIIAENGRVDGMVYAAGIVRDAPLKFLTYEKVLETFKVNYFAFLESVRQITKRVNHNSGLRIVGISSVASVRGEKAHVPYSASKAAMDSTVRCLALELSSKGVYLNTVQPAMIRTEIYDALIEKQGEDSDANRRLLEKQYVGLGKTEDVACSIAFLLSDNARFITGIALPVDGGYTSH